LYSIFIGTSCIVTTHNTTHCFGYYLFPSSGEGTLTKKIDHKTATALTNIGEK